MKKKARVHMLPTEENSQIVLYAHRTNPFLVYHYTPINSPLSDVNQHLYFTTDEEIKEGDWYLDVLKTGFPTVHKCGNSLPFTAPKIIATTDPKLLVDFEGHEPYTGRDISAKVYLPQPSQDFIEEYCKAGGIDEVDVEYELITQTFDNLPDLMCPYSTAEYEQTTATRSILKVDLIHNTITTHRIVEKTYSISDIEAYCEKYSNDTELGREIRKLRYKQ